MFAGLTCSQSEMYSCVAIRESVSPKLRMRSSPRAGKDSVGIGDIPCTSKEILDAPLVPLRLVLLPFRGPGQLAFWVILLGFVAVGICSMKEAGCFVGKKDLHCSRNVPVAPFPI